MADGPTYSINVGFTMNLGNYESARVEVGYYGVSTENVEQVVADGEPIITRLFEAARQRASVSAREAKAGHSETEDQRKARIAAAFKVNKEG